MNLFWWLGHWRTDGPGLWDYRSATIGDGFLLPIAAGILMGAGDRLPRAAREIPAVCAASLLGAFAGGGVQWAALRDPHPEINWTSPAAHTLNAAGWYHAGLLVTVSGLFAGLIMRVLLRARSCWRCPGCAASLSLCHPATMLVVTCLASFIGLLIVDAGVSRDTVASAAAIDVSLGAAIVVSGVLTWGFGWNRVVQARGFIGAGLAIAAVLCWFAS